MLARSLRLFQMYSRRPPPDARPNRRIAQFDHSPRSSRRSFNSSNNRAQRESSPRQTERNQYDQQQPMQQQHRSYANQQNQQSHQTRQPPQQQQQQQQHQSHRQRNKQKQHGHTPPKETLSQFTFNEISPEHFSSLDIYPETLDDLLLPGKGVCYLTSIVTVAQNQFGNVGKIEFNKRPVENNWVGILTINFPKEKTFVCKHRNTKECKNLCCLAAVHHLREINAVDRGLKVNVDMSVANKFIDSIKGPITITPIPMNMKQQMISFVGKFDEYISNLLDYRVHQAKEQFNEFDISIVEGKHATLLEGLDLDEGIGNTESMEVLSSGASEQGPIDIFMSRPYVSPDPRKRVQSFASLKKVFSDKEKKYRSDRQFYDLVQTQEHLPIRSMKSRVISALEDHKVIVIAGDTGSGKSTQVPQFIMENFIGNDANASSFANIAITQPRRISAISLAERVSNELGEPRSGHTVGHNIRFDSKLPERDLNIMTFFTTGMLLKKLQRNPDLKGVSHLIIDEVHERDCTTDFLLILIKRLLTRRRDLRVILMSASMDATLFARYFDNCPIISVSGRCYPVENIYLDAISREIRIPRVFDEPSGRAPKLNYDVLVDLIRYIDETRDNGAILCFLPGWKDMKTVQNELEKVRSRNHLKVLLAHSKIPIQEQRLIFGHAQPRERKVILSTNIAETSITINDVRYVIDTGLCNSIDYDPETNMSAFSVRWISKANAKQRTGRAGRTSPGECFKLYTQEEESLFPEYPAPELMRIPLESVIMEVKCHCPNERAVNFLSQAIQYPTINAIHNALDELMLLGLLDHREDLTILGKRIAGFSSHPRLSVALVVASALRCLYPVLNTSAVLSSTQEPFLTLSTENSVIRATKERLCNDVIDSNLRDPLQYMSDHVAYGNLLALYDQVVMSKHEYEYFVEENNLNRTAMKSIQDFRNMVAKSLVNTKFVENYEWYSYDSLPNRNMNDLEFMIAAITHSFYPKIVRVIKGKMSNGRLYPNKVSPTEVQTNSRVRLAADSLVRNISMGKQLNSAIKEDAVDSDEDSDYLSMGDFSDDRRPTFITYLNSRLDKELGTVVIRDGSVVPALTLLLFGGRELSIQDPSSRQGDSSSDLVSICLDRHNLLTFKVNKDDSFVIQEWRKVWQKYFEWYVHTKNAGQSVEKNDAIIAGTMNEFLELNKKLYASLR